ncbi:hypothetical protein [Bosea beijingensis]|uniref:hypothetical protein n=1 Tax=Bosea beijingensis TaxID=3068632 RepID=UPI002740E57D|nr:hypothetical protein [Bosea sp. REN20]
MREQQQHLGSGYAVRPIEPALRRRGKVSSAAAIAATDIASERRAARRSAEALKPYAYAIAHRPGGRPVASGTLFAPSRRQGQAYARELALHAAKVISFTFGHRDQPSFGCSVRIEDRPLPLPDPPVFAFRREDWMTYAAEFIVSGLPILREAPSVTGERAIARRALRGDVADAYVADILKTDPNVRLSRAARKAIGWTFLSAHFPGHKAGARVALHVTADDDAVALSPTTIMAVLCVLLRCNNYNRETGMSAHRDGTFAASSSATGRAAEAQSQLLADPRRSGEVARVMRYLDRLGLKDLSRAIEEQAAIGLLVPGR